MLQFTVLKTRIFDINKQSILKLKKMEKKNLTIVYSAKDFRKLIDL